jgi:hypothetical protein
MRSHEPRGRHDLDEADVVVLAPWRGFPSAAGEPAYVSWMRIERLGGPQRLAYLPAEDDGVRRALQVADRYGISPDQYPRTRPLSTTS